MIVQALHSYYMRKRSSGELAPHGFERKGIPFIAVIDERGKLVQLEDTREGSGPKRRSREFLVPQAVKRASGISANLLWDTAEYVLATSGRGKDARVAQQHAAFVDRLTTIRELTDDVGLSAVLRFVAEKDVTRIASEPAFAELAETNAVMAFRLVDDSEQLICQRPAIVEAIRAAGQLHDAEQERSFCAIQGAADAPARLHPAIKRVWGAQSSGANMVSFNLDAFESYGRKQGANAPIGSAAAFAYTTALNHLLRKGSPQRMQVGDTSTVFWASGPSRMEEDFAALFGVGSEDNPDHRTQAVRNLYASVSNGLYVPQADRDTEFFVLGLAPNAARVAVRFWYRATVADLAPTILQHLEDFTISKPDFAPEHLSMFALLNSIALLGRADNVPPNLGGDVFRSALSGLPYPAALLPAAIRRIRAEREVGHPRAAVLKACLNRQIRHRHLDAKELHVNLDRENRDPGYRLGRLFAALERIQSAAQPGINATIRDRYYGAASSSPSSVFPVLLRLKNHHLSKLDNPRLSGWFEKTLMEIFSAIESFPAHLPLASQGMFAVGYYHQQQDFYASRAKPTSLADQSNESEKEKNP